MTQATDTEQQQREDFLRRRKKGVGGSDVGAILGVNQYRDAIDVFLDKTQDQEDVDNPNMERGRMMEPVVLKKWMMATGRRVKPGKFRKHKMYPWLLGNPDALIMAKHRAPAGGYNPIEDGNGVLELKTANQYVFRRIKEFGLPQSYLVQLQHYMGVCGVEWGSFGVLCCDPWDFLHFDIAFDPNLFDEVAYVLERFWRDHVMRGIPPIPEPVDWGDAPEVSADEEVHVLDTSTWEGAVDLFREAKNMLRMGKEYEDQAKELLKLEVEFKPGVYEGAGARIYYREQAGRSSFLRRELAALQPLDPIAMATLLEKTGLELDVIEVLFEEARLDLSIFEKRGEPFTTLRMYDGKG